MPRTPRDYRSALSSYALPISLARVREADAMINGSVSIRSRLTRMLFLSSGAVLAVTTVAFCAYEAVTFRHASVQQLETLSQVIATNSTAALAFENSDDAAAVLAAFKADPHIVAAALYDGQGRLFA